LDFLILTKKNITMFKILKKFRIILSFIIIFIFIITILSTGKVYQKNELKYGVTFSQKQAESLGLNWKDVFTKTLDELNVKRLRLAAYWDLIEPTKDNYDYSDLDWQITEAEKRDATVILAVGMRLPRWPECHSPEWSKKITKEKREKEILNYIRKTIIRYRDYDNIAYWQIENEPFLINFGECPKLDTTFLDKEIYLVKSLSNKPIIITDSGELSLWVQAAKRADVFGTSLYLKTFSAKLNRYVHYPITPGFFHFKKNVTNFFTNTKNSIVIELQAEPWGPINYQEMSEKERNKTMSLNQFKKIINFSSKTGFQTFYLWGVEWWYWEKDTNNNPIFWEEAKTIFNHSN